MKLKNKMNKMRNKIKYNNLTQSLKTELNKKKNKLQNKLTRNILIIICKLQKNDR